MAKLDDTENKGANMLFLVCNMDGYIMDCLSALNFKEAYANSLGRNFGEILIEIDKDTVEKIKALGNDIK